VLEVVDGPFEDGAPIFYPENDPFTIRFHVQPLAWLPKELAIPIHEDYVWNTLSFTRGLPKNSYKWTGKLRNSLNLLSDEDGSFLEQIIYQQLSDRHVYPVDEAAYQRMLTHGVAISGKLVTVSIPDAVDEDTEETQIEGPEIRESLQIQSLLARIGEQMGFRIWLPKSDRSAVLRLWHGEAALIERLPLNYDDATIRTIEQIDVLWMKGRFIARAFEVEHSTSIYSGLLRMADLLALQPNMEIKLHIVAPDSRREKVFQELLRPVFSLLESAPLAERCSYISYDSVRELAHDKNLKHLSDSVLEEYEEEA
jgi:hypothetical protein